MVGSSSSSNDGSWSRARANDTRLFWPPLQSVIHKQTIITKTTCLTNPAWTDWYYRVPKL